MDICIICGVKLIDLLNYKKCENCIYFINKLSINDYYNDFSKYILLRYLFIQKQFKEKFTCDNILNILTFNQNEIETEKELEPFKEYKYTKLFNISEIDLKQNIKYDILFDNNFESHDIYEINNIFKNVEEIMKNNGVFIIKISKMKNIYNVNYVNKIIFSINAIQLLCKKNNLILNHINETEFYKYYEINKYKRIDSNINEYIISTEFKSNIYLI